MNNDIEEKLRRFYADEIAALPAVTPPAVPRLGRTVAHRPHVLAVLAAAAAVIAIAVVVPITLGHHGATKTGTAGQPAPQSVVAAISAVPSGNFEAAQAAASAVTSRPAPVRGEPILTSDGKPQLLYIDADYCPYCAAERWPLAVALSRFGSFSGLTQTSSSARDVVANIATLSFIDATYRSPYITFTSVDTQSSRIVGDDFSALQRLTASQQSEMDKLDPPAGGDLGPIPFIDYANQYAHDGSNYDPQILAGLTHQQIAAALAQPASKVGATILATANVISAYICKIDGQMPTEVCRSKPVTAANGGG